MFLQQAVTLHSRRFGFRNFPGRLHQISPALQPHSGLRNDNISLLPVGFYLVSSMLLMLQTEYDIDFQPSEITKMADYCVLDWLLVNTLRRPVEVSSYHVFISFSGPWSLHKTTSLVCTFALVNSSWHVQRTDSPSHFSQCINKWRHHPVYQLNM